MSCVNTEPPSPNGESLATAMASASSLTLNTIDTGPKNSHLKAGFSSVTLVSSTGRAKEPFDGTSAPITSSLAPRATAWSICFFRSSTAACDDSGASVVSGSIGSPALSAATPARYFSMKAS